MVVGVAGVAVGEAGVAVGDGAASVSALPRVRSPEPRWPLHITVMGTALLTTAMATATQLTDMATPQLTDMATPQLTDMATPQLTDMATATQPTDMATVTDISRDGGKKKALAARLGLGPHAD
jgi:hypothetical protein